MIFRNIGDVRSTPQIQELLKNNGAYISKCYYELYKKSRRKAELSTCILCGKKIEKSFHSHTIPQMILKKMSYDHNYYYWKILCEYPKLKDKLSLKEVDTFRLICHECDNKLFKKYENNNAYKYDFDNDILQEIALKNYLNIYAKSLYQIEFLSLVSNIYNGKLLRGFQYQREIAETNLQIYFDMISESKKVQYEVILEKQLPYVAGFTVQTAVNLITGLRGEVINQFLDDGNEVYPLHICVFPLDFTTKIIMFINKKDKFRYQQFINDFSEKDLEEKLNIIAYLIPMYTDKFFVTEKLANIMKGDNALKKHFQTFSWIENTLTKEEKDEVIKRYSLKNYKSIENYLSEKYKIRGN